jgi:hypothetical protein
MTLALGIALLLSTVARGEPADEAHRLFEHGTAQYALHHFAAAADDFEKAFELKPDPAILYNAAQAHRFAGNKARALELYESYVRLYGDRPNAAEAGEHARQLRSAIEAEKQATTAPSVGTVPLTSSGTTPQTSGGAALTTTTTTAPPPSRPLVKRPWFWAVVGGVVVVAAVGIGVGVGVKKDPSPTYGVVNGN